MSFVNVYEFFVCVSFPFDFEDRMWVFIVLIPDHCRSIYFSIENITLSQNVIHTVSRCIVTDHITSCNKAMQLL